MNFIKSLLIASCLMFASTPLLAAEAPVKPLPGVVDQSAVKKPKKSKDKLEKKFCCKTESGTGCYVFGDASCTNCTSFCSGDMVIETLPKL